MQFVGMSLNDGCVEPEFALQPLFHVTAREWPTSLRDLLPERVLREFEEERPFGRFRGHVVGSGSCPHKGRRFLRSPRSFVLVSFKRAVRTRRVAWCRARRFPSSSSRLAPALAAGARDF